MKRLLAITVCLVFAWSFFAAAGEKLTIRIGFSANMEDPRYHASVAFKNEVEKVSGGKIAVEIYPAGQLGSDAALIEAIALDSGTVDVAMTDVSNMATFEPKVGLSSLPFSFTTFEEAWEFMDSDLEKEVEDLLIPHNLRVIAHYCNGFRCVTTANKRIEKPDDMKGVLIRTPENPVYMATMRALGANPQPLPFAEVYMALQQGTYDGQENPVSVIYNSKLYEVQKFIAITNHVYAGNSFTISNSLWESMTDEQRKIVGTAARNSAEVNRKLSKQMCEDYTDELAKKGMTVTKPDLKPFMDKTKSVYEEVRGKYGDDLLKRFADWKAARR